jgi:hypothetical protein
LVDTNLVRSDDGIRPANALVDLKLSDGGTEPFVALAEGADTIALQWDGALPEPTLLDNTATYPNVISNGDLIVTVSPTGFSYEFILREEPQAPVSFTVPVDVGDGNLRQTAQGGLEISDSDGDAILRATRPLMWDAEQEESPNSEDVRTVSTTVGEAADGTPTIQLEPSLSYLQAPTTEYPVTVDPAFTNYASGDSWVENVGAYSTGQSTSTELRVGTKDSGLHKARSFLRFDSATNQLLGKQILSAKLTLRNFESLWCSNGTIRASRIDEAWGINGLTWANQPAVTPEFRAEYDLAHGASAACDAAYVNFDISKMAQRWADGVANRGIRLSAADETSNSTWRRYRSSNMAPAGDARHPYITITYNSYPSLTSVVSVSDSAVVGGILNTGSAQPTLSARVTDADPGTMAVQFEISQGTQVLVPFASGQGTQSQDGADSTFLLPAGVLANYGTYSVRARGFDGNAYSPATSALTFRVDPTLPMPAVITSSAYPANNTWNGQVGQQGVFNVQSQRSDTTQVRARLNDSPTFQTKSLQGLASTSFSFAPDMIGRNTLSVELLGAGGVWSRVVEHSFLVGSLGGASTTSLVNEIVKEHFSGVVRTVDPLDPPDAAIDAEIAADAGADPMAGVADTPADVDDDTETFSDPVVDDQFLTTDELPQSLLTLPPSSDGQIAQITPSGDTPVSLDMPNGVSTSAAALVDGDVVVYPNSEPGVDTLAVRGSVDELETFQLIRDSAVTSFRYVPTLAPGVTVTAYELDSIVAIVDPVTDAQMYIKAPLAVDAAGAEIPIALSVEEGTNAIEIEMNPGSGQVVQYPVLVDPFISLSGWLQRTPAEIRYCIYPPHVDECYESIKDSKKAYSSMRYRYDKYPKSSYLGAADSYRHCYWNARMRQHIGSSASYQIATRHESTSAVKDRDMDLGNNKVGRKIGKAHMSSKHPIMNSVRGCQYLANHSDTYNPPDYGGPHFLYMVGPWHCTSPRPPSLQDQLYKSRLPWGCET